MCCPLPCVVSLQWQRAFRAVDWWQRAAAAALDNGGYADALPLLQRAQVGQTAEA